MDKAPANFVDLLVLPGICVFFTLLLRLGAWGRERNGAKPSLLKYASILPAMFGAYVGARYVWAIHEPNLGYLYTKTIDGKKVLFSHYIALGLPLAVIVAIVLWNQTERRLGRPLSF